MKIERRHRGRPESLVIECGNCHNSVTATGYRQKYCGRNCRNIDYRTSKPRVRIWGKPEYYEKKKLEREGFKKCKECETVKAISDFWKVRHLIHSRCKTCAAARQKSKRKPDRNLVAARRREKVWRERHPELCRQISIEKRIRDPQASTRISLRRRVKKEGNGVYVVTKEDLRKLLVRQRGDCYICLLPLGPKKHLDHIVPVKKGGCQVVGQFESSGSGS